jgi:hypothetical protein
MFVVLPALWAADDTQPAAQAELRSGDDRLVLVFDAPNWKPGEPWKATWQMRRVAAREQLVAARRSLNERYRAAHPEQSADAPVMDASAAPASATGGLTREDVTSAATVGAVVLTAVGALVAALGPGNTALLITYVSLIVVGLIAALVLVKRAGLPRWAEVRRRPWLLVGAVATAFAVVAVVVVVVNALTAESWHERADRICYDSGNQYVAATGTPYQRARTRLEVSQRALSALQNLENEVPFQTRPAFNSMLADKRKVIDYLRQEVGLASEGKPTESVDDDLTNYYVGGYEPDANALGLSVCGHTTGRQ